MGIHSSYTEQPPDDTGYYENWHHPLLLYDAGYLDAQGGAIDDVSAGYHHSAQSTTEPPPPKSTTRSQAEGSAIHAGSNCQTSSTSAHTEFTDPHANHLASEGTVEQVPNPSSEMSAWSARAQQQQNSDDMQRLWNQIQLLQNEVQLHSQQLSQLQQKEQRRMQKRRTGQMRLQYLSDDQYSGCTETVLSFPHDHRRYKIVRVCGQCPDRGFTESELASHKRETNH